MAHWEWEASKLWCFKAWKIWLADILYIVRSGDRYPQAVASAFVNNNG